MFNTGIYQITNIINDKKYIGSSKTIDTRKYSHFNILKRQKHYNKHLQKSYNKYGKENFKFEILLYCSSEDLIFYEQRAIDAYNFDKELYNMRPKAESNLGIKLSEEHKRKIRESNKGKIVSEETKEKLRKINLGKKHSEKTKNKLRESYKNMSEEKKKKLSRKGETRSEKTKKKISDSTKGNKNPMFGRSVYSLWVEKYGEEIANKKQKEANDKNKISNSGEKNGFYGKKHSKETNEKNRKAHIGKHKGEKNPMYGKSVHDVWTEKYGKEVADRKWEEKIKKTIETFKKKRSNNV